MIAKALAEADLPEDVREFLAHAVEARALLRKIDGKFYAFVRVERWEVYPADPAEPECVVDGSLKSCTCGEQDCKHIRTLKYGG